LGIPRSFLAASLVLVGRLLPVRRRSAAPLLRHRQTWGGRSRTGGLDPRRVGVVRRRRGGVSGSLLLSERRRVEEQEKEKGKGRERRLKREEGRSLESGRVHLDQKGRRRGRRENGEDFRTRESEEKESRRESWRIDEGGFEGQRVRESD
jgi:hypothetical protein